MNIIEVDGLTKRAGRRTVVAPATFEVAQGSVFGVLGPTGSGKTTLMRMLATLLEPSDGDAFINGASVRAHRELVRQLVGYMPADFGAYNDLTLQEYLVFFAGCFHVPDGDRAATAGDLLQLVDLYHRRDDAIERLSRSQRHRLALARALVHDPPVLLLDEPFAHLDPKATVEMRDLFKELQSLGKTIVFTSAAPTETHGVCDSQLMLDQGAITTIAGGIDTDVRRYRVLEVRYLGHVDTALTIARECVGSELVFPTTIETAPGAIAPLQSMKVHFEGGFRDASALLRALVRGAVQVISFRELTDAPLVAKPEAAEVPVPAPLAEGDQANIVSSPDEDKEKKDAELDLA